MSAKQTDQTLIQVDNSSHWNLTLIQVDNSSHWDLYLGANRQKLVAIPNEKGSIAGCSGCYYGDKWHLLSLMRQYPHPRQFEGFTEAGLEYMSGLYSTIDTRWLCFDKALG